jgi:hypothetical protein
VNVWIKSVIKGREEPEEDKWREKRNWNSSHDG